MSIFVWLSVVLLPTIAIPTTLTFTLSSKPKEIVDGLDKLGIVNRKEKKETTTLAPVVSMPSSSSGGGRPPAPAARPAATKPAPAKPAPPAPQSPPQPQQQQQQQQDQGVSEKGDQGDDSADSHNGNGQQGEGQGHEGEPGLENEGPKISLADIALDSISRINTGTPLVMGGKGDILNHFEMVNALSRILNVIEDLKKQDSGQSTDSQKV